MIPMSNALAAARRDRTCTDELAARAVVCRGLPRLEVRTETKALTRAPRWRGLSPGVWWPLTDEQAGFRAMPEVSLSEALADPIVQSLMAADRVDPDTLEADLAGMAKQLGYWRRDHIVDAE